MVCLANLTYNVSGVADDDEREYYGGYGGRKRHRWYNNSDEDHDGGTPDMIEEVWRSTISWTWMGFQL